MFKYIIAALSPLVLFGCQLTSQPETKIITNTETKYVQGIPVTFPERPEPIIPYIGPPEMKVISARTLSDDLVSAFKKTGAPPEDIELFQNMLLAAIYEQEQANGPYNHFAVSKDEYFRQAELLESAKAWIKKAVAEREYLESLNIQIIPEEDK